MEKCTKMMTGKIAQADFKHLGAILMKKDYFIIGKVTLTNAFQLFNEAYHDKDNSKPIHVNSNDFREISIFYHAAKHFGFTATHFRVDGDKYLIKSGIIRIAEWEWKNFIQSLPPRWQKIPKQNNEFGDYD